MPIAHQFGDTVLRQLRGSKSLCGYEIRPATATAAEMTSFVLVGGQITEHYRFVSFEKLANNFWILLLGFRFMSW